MRKYLMMAAALAGVVFGQVLYKASGSPFRTYKATLSSTPLNACSGDCYVSSVTFSSGSASGTVSYADGGVACSSGPCSGPQSTAIAANTVYSIPLYGAFYPNGLNVSAPTGTGIHVTVTWSTQPPEGSTR